MRRGLYPRRSHHDGGHGSEMARGHPTKDPCGCHEGLTLRKHGHWIRQTTIRRLIGTETRLLAGAATSPSPRRDGYVARVEWAPALPGAGSPFRSGRTRRNHILSETAIAPRTTPKKSMPRPDERSLKLACRRSALATSKSSPPVSTWRSICVSSCCSLESAGYRVCGHVLRDSD